MNIDFNEAEIKDLKLVRNYFGENDKTTHQHFCFDILNNAIKKIEAKIALDAKPDFSPRAFAKNYLGEAEMKDLISRVSTDQISFGRMVEIINERFNEVQLTIEMNGLDWWLEKNNWKRDKVFNGLHLWNDGTDAALTTEQLMVKFVLETKKIISATQPITKEPQAHEYFKKAFDLEGVVTNFEIWEMEELYKCMREFAEDTYSFKDIYLKAELNLLHRGMKKQREAYLLELKQIEQQSVGTWKPFDMGSEPEMKDLPFITRRRVDDVKAGRYIYEVWEDTDWFDELDNKDRAEWQQWSALKK